MLGVFLFVIGVTKLFSLDTDVDLPFYDAETEFKTLNEEIFKEESCKTGFVSTNLIFQTATKEQNGDFHNICNFTKEDLEVKCNGDECSQYGRCLKNSFYTLRFTILCNGDAFPGRSQIHDFSAFPFSEYSIDNCSKPNIQNISYAEQDERFNVDENFTVLCQDVLQQQILICSPKQMFGLNVINMTCLHNVPIRCLSWAYIRKFYTCQQIPNILEADIQNNGQVQINMTCNENENLKIINISLQARDTCGKQIEDSCNPSGDENRLKSICNDNRSCVTDFQFSNDCALSDAAYYSGKIQCGDRIRLFPCLKATQKVGTFCSCDTFSIDAWFESTLTEQCLQTAIGEFPLSENIYCQFNGTNSKLEISNELLNFTDCFKVPKELIVTYFCTVVQPWNSENVTESYLPKMQGTEERKLETTLVLAVVFGTLAIVMPLILAMTLVFRRFSKDKNFIKTEIHKDKKKTCGEEQTNDDRTQISNHYYQEIEIETENKPNSSTKTVNPGNNKTEGTYSFAKSTENRSFNCYSLAKPLDSDNEEPEDMKGEYDKVSGYKCSSKDFDDYGRPRRYVTYDRISDNEYDGIVRKLEPNKNNDYDQVSVTVNVSENRI